MAPTTLGVWGPVTSTVDFCEENYAVTSYVAEFWNTLTCLAYVALCVYGVVSCLSNQLENRFVLSYCGLLIVGVGSVCLHATLWFETQVLDELPMVFSTCVFIFCILEDERDIKYPWLPCFLLLLCALFTALYFSSLVVNPHFVLIVAYGVLVLFLTFRCYRLTQTSTDRTTRTLFVHALVCYGSGFALWLVDVLACTHVRAARGAVWSGAGAVTQLHGWWHVLSAVGTYSEIVLSVYARQLVLQRSVGVRFLLGLPLLTFKRHGA